MFFQGLWEFEKVGTIFQHLQAHVTVKGNMTQERGGGERKLLQIVLGHSAQAQKKWHSNSQVKCESMSKHKGMNGNI